MIIRASPIKQYLKIWIGIAIFLVLMYVITSLIKVGVFGIIALIVVVLGILASAAYRYIYNHFYIKLTERDVVYYSGIININTVNVPYEKIDNVRIKRSFLSRILGLVDIHIDTPGQKGIEILAKDMPFSEYQAFYTELRNRMAKKKKDEEGYP